MVDRPVLYFLHQPGCPVCLEAEPMVARFEEEYGHNVKVVSVDITAVEWKARWSPKAMPTFVVLRPNRRPVSISGGFFTYEEFETWVQQKLF